MTAQILESLHLSGHFTEGFFFIQSVMHDLQNILPHW